MPDPINIQVQGLGGLNTSLPPDQLQDNEFQVLQNVVIRNGRLQKRPGAKRIIELGSESVTLHNVGIISRDNAGLANIIFHDAENFKLYCTNGSLPSDLSQLFELSSDVRKVLTNLWDTSFGAYCVVEKIDNTLQLVRITPNGTPKYNLMSSNLRSAPADRENHSWIWEHDNRLWVLNSRAIMADFDGAVIGFSEPGNYETLDTTNDSPRLVQISNSSCFEAQPLSDRILIFSTYDGIHQLITSGSPRNWSLLKIDYTTASSRSRRRGTSSPTFDQRYGFLQSSVKYKELIYYLALDGVYVTDGNSSKKLNDPINNLIRIPSVGKVTPTDALVITEYSGIDIFNEFEDELIIKVTYADTYPPRFFVYNIPHNTWTELTFGLAPLDAPVYSDIRYNGQVNGLPYPYTFESIFYLPYSVGLDGRSSEVPGGLYLFSNSHLVEKNQVYLIEVQPRKDEELNYADIFSDGNIVKVKSKSFDFGNKSILKKIPKVFLTLGFRQTDYNSDILPTPDDAIVTIKQYADDILIDETHHTISETNRRIKLGGSGYCQEYAIEISTEDAVDPQFYMDIQSISLDTYAKPEQSKNVGI